MTTKAELEQKIARLEVIVESLTSNKEREHPGNRCPRCGGGWRVGLDMWLNWRRECRNCFLVEGKKFKR